MAKIDKLIAKFDPPIIASKLAASTLKSLSTT